MTLSVGSLFSGLGAFDIAFQRAGCRIAWQVERDEHANRVLARQWPDVPKYRDVRDVGENLERTDIIVGGWPCQDLSVAGRRAGLAGARSGLFHELVRVVRAVRPAWLCLENVPGLLSAGGGRDFAIVLNELADSGYGLAWRVCDAQYWGVAQRRRRVFLVGHLAGPVPASILFESPGVCGNSPAGRETGQSLAGTLGGGSGRRGWCDDTDRATFVAHSLTAEGHDASEDGTGRGTPVVAVPPQDVSSREKSQNGLGVVQPGDPASTADTGGSGGIFLPFDTTQITSAANRSNPQPGDPCHPLAAGAHAPAVATEWAVRRLLPVECLRLMALPDDWLDGCGLSDSAKYRLIGNSLVVTVAQWIGERLLAAEEAQ